MEPLHRECNLGVCWRGPLEAGAGRTPPGPPPGVSVGLRLTLVECRRPMAVGHLAGCLHGQGRPTDNTSHFVVRRHRHYWRRLLLCAQSTRVTYARNPWCPARTWRMKKPHSSVSFLRSGWHSDGSLLTRRYLVSIRVRTHLLPSLQEWRQTAAAVESDRAVLASRAQLATLATRWDHRRVKPPYPGTRCP